MRVGILSSKKLLEDLGEDFKRRIEETNLNVYEIGHKKMKDI